MGDVTPRLATDKGCFDFSIRKDGENGCFIAVSYSDGSPVAFGIAMSIGQLERIRTAIDSFLRNNK